MAIHRTVVAPDIHTPLHDEPSIKALLDFIKWFKPHRFVQLGDFCDFNSLSSYDLHKTGEFVYLEDELDAANALLDRFDKALPKKCEKFMVGGNHEDRYPAFLAKWMFFPDRVSKSLRKFSESWGDEYNLSKRKWKWCDYGGYFKFGKLTYTHGWASGPSAPLDLSRRFPGQNVLAGHTHQHSVYGCLNEDGLPIEVETIGTLSRFDLAYLRGKPPYNWTRGFSHIFTMGNGVFTKRFTHIIQGRFVEADRVFDGNQKES